MPTISRAARCCLILFLLVATQASCTGMRPGFEAPTVTVSSFRSLPSQGGLPNFEIGLKVLNPNPDPLKLRGVSYTVSLDGHDLVKGVGNQLPVIDAYGEGELILTASANLLAGLALITDLMQGPKDSFRWDLEAKLDVGAFTPAIRVRESGEISLRGQTPSSL